MDTNAFKGRSLLEIGFLKVIVGILFSPVIIPYYIYKRLSGPQKPSNLSNSYYTFSLPNIDIIVSILPFLLLGILIFAAYFATYILYGEVLLYPSPT
jgi:hypothetical protein